VLLECVFAVKDGKVPIVQSLILKPYVVYLIVQVTEILTYNYNNAFVMNDGLDPTVHKVLTLFISAFFL
jgi:hypothetical protein